jgi:hypothetical protein
VSYSIISVGSGPSYLGRSPQWGSHLRLAGGGSVSGPGTGTSDDIPALLSDGEFVVNARSTERYYDLLRAINGGDPNGDGRFAKGGKAKKPKKTAKQKAKEAKEAREQHPLNELTNSFTGSVESITEALAVARRQIIALYGEKYQKKLIKQLDKASDDILKLARRFDDANRALDAATGARSAAVSSALGMTTVSGLGNTGDVGSLLELMQFNADQVKDFKRSIDALNDKGFASSIVSAVGAMGVEEGNEFARVLMLATAEQVKALNEAEAAAITKATSLGNTVWAAVGGNALANEVAKLTEQQRKMADAIAGKLTSTPLNKKTKQKVKPKIKFDDGGDLKPGATLAWNETGRTESVVTAEWREKVEKALMKLSEGKGGTINVYVTFKHPIDPNTAAKRIVDKIIDEAM